jgi:hypothetical protein
MTVRMTLIILLFFTLSSAHSETIGVQVKWVQNHNYTKNLDFSNIKESDNEDVNIRIYDMKRLLLRQDLHEPNINLRDNRQVGIKKYTKGLETIIDVIYL